MPNRVTLSLCCSLLLGAAQAFAADSPIYKVGSWASYKMSTKTETAPAAGAQGGAGAGGQAGSPDMSAMMANLPPAQRAKYEAAMAQQKAMTAQTSGMAKSGGSAANDMMKDMRMKISVVGEEKRDGKDCIWLEVSINGKMPDLDKMMDGYKGMMAQMSEEQKQKVADSMAKAKKKMEKMPIRTKDGRLKMVMKILVEKPDPKAAVELKPIEVWKQQGDNPVVKLSGEDVAKFGKGESARTHKSKSRSTSDVEMHSETEMKQHLVADEAKRAEISENADKVGQAAAMGKQVAQLIPGGQTAAMGLGVLGELSALTSDVANLQVEMKATMDVKAKTDVSQETESHTETKLVSRESSVIGGEEVQVAALGEVKAVHTQAKETRERVDTTKSKITDAKIETNVKVDVSGGVGVDGGAKSMTGKAFGGLMKGAKFASDPFGLKKKKADQQAADTQKQISEGASSGIKGMETDAVSKTRQIEMKDYWISPAVPAMGLVKMEQSTQEGDTETSTSVQGGMYGQQGMDMSAMQGMNPMAGMGMGGAPKPSKPKTVITTMIDQVGTTGAQSELQ